MSKTTTEPIRDLDVEPSMDVTVAPQEVDLLDLILVLAKHKRGILRITLAIILASVIVSFFLRNKYVAETRIMPPQQSQSIASSLLGQLGPLAGLAGGGSKDLLKNPSDIYVAMLQGRTVQDALIKRFELMKVYRDRNIVDAREDLQDYSRISAAPSGVISVAVEDTDPNRAAEMANAYIDELSKLNNLIAVSEASQRRFFFERSVKSAREDLNKAEAELEKTQEKTGLIQLDAQARAIITSDAAIRGQMAAKEVQLRSMKAYATDQNPEVVRLKEEIAGFQALLEKSEQGKAIVGKGDILLPTGKVPAAGLEYIRSFREVKYAETVFEILAKQLEIAKVDEAKSASIIQVIDQAIPPEKRSKPKRTLIIVIAAMSGFFLAIVWAFLRESIERMKKDPAQYTKLRAIQSHLAGPI